MRSELLAHQWPKNMDLMQGMLLYIKEYLRVACCLTKWGI